MEERSLRVFLQELTVENKKKLRRYEDSYKRIIDATEAVNFNENCIREKLCPKSIGRCGRAWTRWNEVEKILRQRIREAETRIRENEEEKERRREEFCATTTEEDQRTAFTLMDMEISRYRQSVITRHAKKFFILQ